MPWDDLRKSKKSLSDIHNVNNWYILDSRFYTDGIPML